VNQAGRGRGFKYSNTPVHVSGEGGSFERESVPQFPVFWRRRLIHHRWGLKTRDLHIEEVLPYRIAPRNCSLQHVAQ